MSEQVKIIKPQAGFQERFVRSNVDFAIGGGVLNPQPIDSLVATPNGFVRIGDLKAGDLICDSKGGTQKVNFVLGKGLQPCVEFTLSDGRTVRSALSHNWQVRDKHYKVKEMTAQEIINYYDSEVERSKKRKQGRRNLLKVTLSSPVCLNKEKELKIHPYVLGFILGDGCMTKKASKPTISTYDKDVVDRFNELGYKTENKEYQKFGDYVVSDASIKKHLIELGLWGHTAKDKFIPQEYKHASVQDRLELLKGLFDADGYCTFSQNSKSPRVGYVTVSKQMCDDIREIIYSLGGVCGVSEKAPCIRDWGHRISYCLKSYILHPHIFDDKELFYLKRKKTRAIGDEKRSHKLQLAITNYKMLSQKEMVCINVSGEEHLYLTDNYVVTCNCGKTFAAVLSIAEASSDSRFRALFLRNNLGDAKASGGILDTFREVYGDAVEVVESGEPRVTFRESGAKCDVTHVADQSYDKIMQRYKGRQYDFEYFDEGTGYTWDCFRAIYTRNRGTAKWTGKVRMTTNPERDHWLREFLDWYIGADGFIREDREGVVRYFYMNGETVKDVVWGDDKESVYQKCKIEIDRKLAKINGKTGKATYKDMIKSFTFYLGRMSENVASIGNNSGYVGSVAVSGGRSAEQLLEGNWNVSTKNDLDAPITPDMINNVFLADPMRNGDKWITADLADEGTDNLVALAWNGFHIEDILILGRTTPRENAERLKLFAEKHDIADSHIIFDATAAAYMRDYMPDAIGYKSIHKPMGMYCRMARYLKDECYLRLIEVMKRGELSMDDRVANKIYEHQKLKDKITVQNEFSEECRVVRFDAANNGKLALYSKKQMNAKLGKGRSMDLLDPCAMRMFPVLEYPYGEELSSTMCDANEKEEETVYGDSIWNNSFWA